MIIVLDTSAVLRLYIPDGPLPEGLEEAFRHAERGDATLLAPELLLAEAGQVLQKKRQQGLLSRSEMEEILTHLLGLPVTYSSHTPIVARAVDMAQECKLTVYDGLFLALAERHSARLITADKTLRAAAQRLHLV